MQLRSSDERGFTLVEVLITISLMGVVSLALSDLVIGALKQMTATSDRMDVSQGEQLGGAYFARDVAALGLRDYGAATGGESLPFKPSIQLDAADDAGTTCGPVPVAVLRLLSDDWDISVTCGGTAYGGGRVLREVSGGGPRTASGKVCRFGSGRVGRRVVRQGETRQRRGDLLNALYCAGSAAVGPAELHQRRLPGRAERPAEAVVRHRDEQGSSLLMVLVVITVIAVALSALLTRSESAQRVSASLRKDLASAYVADGAMQAAINNLRNSSYNGESGQRCFGLSDTLSLIAFNGLDSVAVTCKPDPKQVVVGCSPTSCNRPDNAILALGSEGITVDQPSAATLRVHGKIFSNAGIDVIGSLSATGTVSARGSCTGLIGALCGLGGTAAADPGYAASVTAVPPHRPMPACTTPNSVVTFLPGYYDDAAALSSMMKGDSACRNSTWWFKPGTYYFDFHNTSNPLLPAAEDVWTLDDGTLVAGTPVNPTGAAIPAPAVPAGVPGACANPTSGASAACPVHLRRLQPPRRRRRQGRTLRHLLNLQAANSHLRHDLRLRDLNLRSPATYSRLPAQQVRPVRHTIAARHSGRCSGHLEEHNCG